MDNITIVLHPGVLPSIHAHWRKQRISVHIREGQLEAGSGTYALLMGLVVLGETTVGDVCELAGCAKAHPLHPLWKKAQAVSWVDTQDMDKLLAVLPEGVSHESLFGPTDRLLGFAVRCLGRNQVVMLCCAADGLRGHKWILAVGVETRAVGSASIITALLTLDAAAPATSIAATNGRLELLHPSPIGPSRHYRSTSGGVALFRVIRAVALGRSDA